MCHGRRFQDLSKRTTRIRRFHTVIGPFTILCGSDCYSHKGGARSSSAMHPGQQNLPASPRNQFRPGRRLRFPRYDAVVHCKRAYGGVMPPPPHFVYGDSSSEDLMERLALLPSRVLQATHMNPGNRAVDPSCGYGTFCHPTYMPKATE